MNFIVKVAFFIPLCLINIEVHACREVWDAMELMNAVSDDGQSLATKGLTGKGVGISIIDYTINKDHPVFANAKIINCGTSEDQKEFSGHHGQYTATPIVGITYPQKQIIDSLYDQSTNQRYNITYWGGLASEVTIYSYPYISSFNEERNKKIAGILDQILTHNVEQKLKGEDDEIKIISMSFKLMPEFFETDIVRKFKNIEEAGILVIHAADNDHQARTISKDTLRASDNWIEVGALSSFKYENKYTGWHGQGYNSGSSYPREDSQENFMWAPGHIIPVAGGEEGACIRSGTSFAGPYVAGTAALLWEKDPSSSYKDIKANLMSCPIYDIHMSTEEKSGGSTISFESHKVQRPVLDIRHLLRG
jgi:subtilisin family serine protease